MSDETFKVGPFTVHVDQDESPESPREWDHLGHMICWHSRYILGDMDRRKPRKGQPQFAAPQEFNDYVKRSKGTPDEPVLLLPLGLLDHSGISIYIGRGASMFDPGGWDSGQVGWIYATRAEVAAEFGVKRVGKRTLAKAKTYLELEVSVYDQFLTGDVRAYWIEDADGESVDSGCGFYGYDYTVSAATEAAKATLRYRHEEDGKVDAMMHI